MTTESDAMLSEASESELQDELQPLNELRLRKDVTVGDIQLAASSDIEPQQLQRSTTQPSLLRRRSSSQLRNSIRDSRKAEVRARFRKTVRTVIIMIGWIKIMLKRKSYSDDENIKVADSLKGFQSEDSNLSFDPSFFRTKKEVDLTAEMKYTLQLAPNDRTADQVQAVMFGLQNLGTFNEYPLEIQEKLARVAFYYSVPSGRLIIRQGHIGFNFYIIVSGKALVNVMKEDAVSGQTQSSIVARLGQGQSFGEIALLHEVARTASIVSQDSMQLLAIAKDDFNAIFMQASAPNELPNHIQFLIQFDFMQHFPIEKLLRQPNACMVTFYRRNALIVADSKSSDFLVIIRSGSCRVLKKLLVNIHDEPTVINDRSDFKQKLSIGPNKAKIDSGIRKVEPEMFDVTIYKKRLALNSATGSNHHVVQVSRSKHEFEQQMQQLQQQQQQPEKKSVAVQVCILKKGDVFGLSDVAFRGEKNFEVEDSASVALISNGAECLLLNKSFFIANATEAVQRNVRSLIRPYPHDEVFEQSYYQQLAWQHYRKHLLYSAVQQLKRNDI